MIISWLPHWLHFWNRKLVTIPPRRDRRKGETRLILVGPDGPFLNIKFHQRANYVWAYPYDIDTFPKWVKLTGVSIQQQVYPGSPVELEWRKS